jgi:palmitoyltransferase ZDHHC9/14/18
MVYIIVTSALHLYFLTVRQKINFREALEHGAGSAVAFSISIVVLWPVLALLSYHLRVC